MVLNSIQTQALFEKEFQKFEKAYTLLSKYAHADKANFDAILPRQLRLFRVRLLLVIGLKIDFDTQYSLVKSKDTAATYVELMKCNESWFAYESMKKYCESMEWKKARSRSPIDFLSEDILNELNVSVFLNVSNHQLQTTIHQNKSFRADIISYLKYLHQHLSNRATTLKGFIQEAISLLEEDNLKLKSTHFFAILYATRNLFVHKGETAKSGVSNYKNKIRLLKIIYDFSILVQLRIINYGVAHQIDAYDLR